MFKPKAIYFEKDIENYKLGKELLEKYPYKNKDILLKAQILMKKGNLYESKEFYKKGLSDNSAPADYLEYAKLCITLSLYDEGMEYLNKIKETYMKNRAIQEEAKLNEEAL